MADSRQQPIPKITWSRSEELNCEEKAAEEVSWQVLTNVKSRFGQTEKWRRDERQAAGWQERPTRSRRSSGRPSPHCSRKTPLTSIYGFSRLPKVTAM